MFGFFSKKKPAQKAPAKKATVGAKPTQAAPAKAKPAQAAPAPASAGDSLERAKAELATKSAAKSGGGRQALIEQALAVHQHKAKMLDKLPEETRLRLRAMALKAFVLPGNKDKSKLN